MIAKLKLILNPNPGLNHWPEALFYFDSRVLTAGENFAECTKFSAAEPGSVWDKIFKKNMKLDESCIGEGEAKRQTEYSDKLYTKFYHSFGDEPCSSNL